MWAIFQTKSAPSVPMIPVKNAPASRSEDDEPGAHPVREPVDQHVDADVDAGAHAVRGAELRHPDEHVDAELLGPAQVDPEQPVLQPGNRQGRCVAVHDRDEDHDGGRAHEGRDQPLLEAVEESAALISPVVAAGSRGLLLCSQTGAGADPCLELVGIEPGCAGRCSGSSPCRSCPPSARAPAPAPSSTPASPRRVSVMIWVLPDFLIASSAASFSWLGDVVAVAGRVLHRAFQSSRACPAGRPSQNFLFTTTDVPDVRRGR